MPSKEEIINAINVLRETCENIHECSKCPLRNKAGVCGILYDDDYEPYGFLSDIELVGETNRLVI